MIICHAIRMWLLSLAVMSVAGWVTTALAFLALYVNEALTVRAAVMLGVWTAVAPMAATFQIVWWQKRLRVARQTILLGQHHKRLFENMRGEISSIAR
ncbi:hypothetical protein [Nonomuraea gerenzanensis]|uniref:hypothetical protein n=1 Tax=Nonomuraea gerenzanensis TaxID=93944 RepID=UPI001CD9AD06|nr:hypothetical protein [Nonomuraea gerenzanensis]UBU16623.1 hypothetical protein LCN96_16880 [Nonomuraea gerenzanensis]